MKVLETIEAVTAYRKGLKGRMGVVPTMGYLHQGHVSLVREARADCDHVLATIFVNPAQFSPSEDLSAYPRNLPRDLELLEAEGVDAVFTPTPAMMYPPNFQTYVTVERVSLGKEGASRPTHFKGVSTIVMKLFNIAQAHNAYFGQKDAQQVVVIRRMVQDMNMPVNVVVCPIVREIDGLAMSSRNVYLTTQERQSARVLHDALTEAGRIYAEGERHPEAIKSRVIALLEATPLAKVDYISVARASDMLELDSPIEQPYLVSLAVQLGKPRLLDNCLLPMSLNTREGATETLGVE